MEIWLDSSNVQLIKKAYKMGILYGVTTNPSLISQTHRKLEDVIQDILDAQPGPTTVQVTAEEASQMIRQGEKLHAFSPRIIVKVPVTVHGLETISYLSKKGVKTMATVVFDPNQVLVAALAGADYVAPYISAIEREGEDAQEILGTMMHIISYYKLKTKVLAASIKDAAQIKNFARMGLHAITLKDDVFNKFVDTHELTIERMEQFAVDWKKAQSTHLLEIDENR